MHRRHDIDALRALAFGLVILYHVGMYYVAGWGWHVKSPHVAEWLQWPMRAVNLWRLDLVFLISGLSMALLWRGQRPGALLRQRSARLLVPLAFGMVVLVPYQPYAQGVANGLVTPGFGAFGVRYFTGGPWPPGAFDGWREGVTWNHLWYLAYLWVYTAVLLLAQPLLSSAAGERLRQAFCRLRGWRLVVVPALPLLLYTLTLWPRFPPTHDLLHDGWVHAVYLTLFVYGYWIGLDEGFWAEVTRQRWISLSLAMVLLTMVMVWRALADTGALRVSPWRFGLRGLSDVYLWVTLLAILGWAHHTLNRPWRWLPWANESVYPWYMLHQTLIIVGVVWLAPLRLGPVWEPALLVTGTLLACWGLTSVVQRTHWMRPLFGLKARPSVSAAASPASSPSPRPPARPPPEWARWSGPAPAKPAPGQRRARRS